LATTLAPHLEAEALAAFVHPHGSYDKALRANGGAPLDDLAEAVHAHMRDLGWPVEARQMTLVGDRSPARGLQHAAENRNAVLITLGASHRSGLGRVFPGGTAERLMSGSPCPVAIAPSGYADQPRRLLTVGCAFDGSPESRAALAWTQSLARASGARVRVITVHEPLASVAPGFQGLPMIAEDGALRDYRRRVLREAARELEGDGLEVESGLLTGNAKPVLEEESTRLDLLVTGSRGYGPARAVLLGSVSGDLVRHAACPVVVLPRGSETEDDHTGSVAAAQMAQA
jgi:nucleotide-binding universal stress UspA family protein